MGRKSGLFDKWFKNFTITVFTQSFHAIFLMFIMYFLSQIQQNVNDADFLVGIISIVGMAAIIKFEKLIKSVFGIEDSMLGGVNEAKNLMKNMMGAKGAVGIAKSVANPVINGVKNRRIANDLGKSLGAKPGQYMEREKPKEPTKAASGLRSSDLSERAQSIYRDMTDAKNAANAARTPEERQSNNDLAKNLRSNLADQVREDRSKVRTKSAQDSDVASEMRKDREDKKLAERNKKIDEYNTALRNSKMAPYETAAHLAGSVAGLSIAGGMFDEWTEVAAAGNAIAKPINSMASKSIQMNENRSAYAATGNAAFDNREIAKPLRDLAADFKNVGRDIVNATKDANGNFSGTKFTKAVVTSPVNIPIKVLTGGGNSGRGSSTVHVASSIDETE